MFEGLIAAKLANKMFEKNVFKIVKSHAFWGCLLMSLPDFGFGIVFFVAILWHMYSKIAAKCGLSFAQNFWQLTGVGIFVNIFIAFVLDAVLSAFFFFAPFVFYAQFYLSGKLFIETLRKM